MKKNMLKLFGAVMIFSACTLFGFYKSHELKARIDALKGIYAGLDLMYIQISDSAEEIAVILKRCFNGCPDIICNGCSVTVTRSRIKEGDALPLEKLFSKIGQGDCESECAKIRLCKTETEKNIKLAERAYTEGARLRQSLGICAGLALGIMVI